MKYIINYYEESPGKQFKAIIGSHEEGTYCHVFASTQKECEKRSNMILNMLNAEYALQPIIKGSK